LIEYQIAERVKDYAGAAALPGLHHVRMMADDHPRAGVDGGPRKFDLLGVGP